MQAPSAPPSAPRSAIVRFLTEIPNAERILMIEMFCRVKSIDDAVQSGSFPMAEQTVLEAHVQRMKETFCGFVRTFAPDMPLDELPAELTEYVANNPDILLSEALEEIRIEG